ncbi:MAG: hypothetical protein H0U72_09385 [Nitrosospira sp.]|nr:hypothetical protein [Nitrosospira sp.]
MKLTKALNSTINRLHNTRQAKAEERQTKQPGLFDTGTGNDTPLASFSVDVEIDTANAKRERSKFLPIRHPTRDFFLCDMFDYALKDDGASMEVGLVIDTLKKTSIRNKCYARIGCGSIIFVYILVS